MCLQRGQGGGFDTNCCCGCCCCCCCLVVGFCDCPWFQLCQVSSIKWVGETSWFLIIKINQNWGTIPKSPHYYTEFARSAGATVWLTGRLARSPRKAFAENFPPSCLSWPWTTGGPAKRWECLELPEIATDCQIVDVMMLQAPIIITPPTDTRGHVGANLTLDCEARGFPAPTISWQVDLWYHFCVERGIFWSVLNHFVTVWQCGGGDHPSSRWWPRHLNPGIDVQSGYHQRPLSPSWRNVLIGFFSQMRGGPEPLMVTGWAQIVSLDPSYRWRLWDCLRLCEIVSSDPSYRWKAFQ